MQELRLRARLHRSQSDRRTAQLQCANGKEAERAIRRTCQRARALNLAVRYYRSSGPATALE
eukprot:14585250-Alexandrium_andersonii.AAC.1